MIWYPLENTNNDRGDSRGQMNNSILHTSPKKERWSGGAKVSCISRHWGVQQISAYSWARPAFLVAGKGRGGMFLFLLFLHFHFRSSFFPSLLFSSLLLSLLSLYSLSLGDDTKWYTRVDVSLNPNTINPKKELTFYSTKQFSCLTNPSLPTGKQIRWM